MNFQDKITTLNLASLDSDASLFIVTFYFFCSLSYLLSSYSISYPLFVVILSTLCFCHFYSFLPLCPLHPGHHKQSCVMSQNMKSCPMFLSLSNLYSSLWVLPLLPVMNSRYLCHIFQFSDGLLNIKYPGTSTIISNTYTSQILRRREREV